MAGGGGAGESSGDGGDSFEDLGLDDTHTATIEWGDGDETESSDDGGHTQHDEFDSKDKIIEDSGDGDGDNMDPSDSAFPPITNTDSEGAKDSGDDDYNETETIIVPEPGGATDSGDDDPSGTDSESGAEETSSDGDDHGE